MAGGKKKEPIVVAQIMGKWVGGGVEAVIMNYYRHIDRTKVQFDFICDEDSTNIPYEEIEKLGGKVILCPPYQKLHKYMKFLEKLFREKKYRIVHSNINTLSVFPLKAAKRAGVPVRIAHSHSTSNPKEWKKNLMKSVLRPFSKKYATDYFACSELAGRYLFGNKAVNANKVKIIHNAIDVDKFRYDPAARKRIRREIGLDDNDFVIGHIGRFVEQKNHRFLIDIFAEVKKEKKNAKLVLVGQGPLEEEIKEKVKSLNLEKDVVFLGQRNDTNKLYSVFDVFCLPSLYEGLPVVGVEAQTNGVYCVFSEYITKEIMISDDAEYVEIHNAKSCSRTIERMRRREGHVVDEYDVSNQCRSLEDYYCSRAKIRIMHLISTNVYSGAENVACQIINMFKEDGNVDMVYVAPVGKNAEILKEKNIKHIVLPVFNRRHVSKSIAEYAPDIIHAHDIKASVVAASFYKKTCIVSHVHNNHEGMRKKTIKSLLFDMASRKIQKIIWVSDSALKSYRYSNKVLLKSETLYNAIDSEELIKKIEEDENNYGYDYVFLGRLTYQKNPERLVAIASRVIKNNKKIKIAIIGDGELKEKIERLATNYGIGENIIIAGFMQNPYKVLSQSKALIMTSRFEGTPMVVLEAIALGIPVISTPVDGVKKIIVDGKNGYICRTDADFANKMETIMDKKQLNALKNGCKESNKTINNLNHYRSRILAIYEECLGSKL